MRRRTRRAGHFRRNRIVPFQPVIRRSGVIASVMQRRRSVHTPVSLVISARGLALSCPVSAAVTSHTAGLSDPRKSAGLATQRIR